jgi:hypothetical protein
LGPDAEALGDLLGGGHQATHDRVPVIAVAEASDMDGVSRDALTREGP